MYCITLTKTSVVKVSEESVRARNPPFVFIYVCVYVDSDVFVTIFNRMC